MATPMIPQSVSKGEATPHSDPQQPNPPLASPTQTALNPSNSIISTPWACTLSRWRGIVSHEKPKQASISFLANPDHSDPNRPFPTLARPVHSRPTQYFPRDYPPLVVGRGLSSASEAKTDADRLLPHLPRAVLAVPYRASPYQPKPTFPHQFAFTLSWWWGRVRKETKKGNGPYRYGPNQTNPRLHQSVPDRSIPTYQL